MYKIYAFFCYILLCFSYYFMGDNMFQIGDLVTRKSYDNDIVFKIINIEGSGESPSASPPA